MATSDNVIELNGKRYDARTGALLGASHTAIAQPLPAPRPSTGKHLDGFVRPNGAKHVSTATHKSATSAPAAIQNKLVAVPKAVKTIDGVRRPAHPAHATQPHHTAKPVPAAAPKTAHRVGKNSVKAHQPQHAKTLMRRSVHKPKVTPKPAITVSLPAELMAAPESSIAIPRKHSAMQVDNARQARSSSVARHSAIQRFTPHAGHSSVAKATAGTAKHPTISVHHEVPVIEVQPAPALLPPAPKPNLSHHTDIFEHAIKHANSHTQPATKHRYRSRHQRLVNTVAGVAAFLVIGSFIGYLNLPNISLKVASVQAGFKADMPDYRPTGYAMQGGIAHTGKTVSMTFRSGENQFTITQQPSDWSSATLRDNTLALAGAHKTIQTAGRTIYIYDGSNATWVDGTKRFDLTGNAPLSSDEIANLAASM